MAWAPLPTAVAATPVAVLSSPTAVAPGPVALAPGPAAYWARAGPDQSRGAAADRSAAVRIGAAVSLRPRPPEPPSGEIGAVEARWSGAVTRPGRARPIDAWMSMVGNRRS